MIQFLVLAAAAQVQTVWLPPAPSAQVQTLRMLPDLVVKEIRIQDDRTMHVLVANTGTADVREPFAVRASVELSGASYDLKPIYLAPIPSGGQAWASLTTLGLPLKRATSAQAGADLLPEPKPGVFIPWPNVFAQYDAMFSAAFPEAKRCENVSGCIAELDESNNNFAVAGVPRGTPERLDATELAPVKAPERGQR